MEILKKMSKPTIRQKAVFNEVVSRVAAGKPVVLKEVMISKGYSPTTAINPGLNLTNKTAWHLLMAKIDDEEILEKVKSIALGDDTRSCLVAADMIFKLKDRYPDKKIKIGAYDEREAVLDVVKSEEAEEGNYSEKDETD